MASTFTEFEGLVDRLRHGDEDAAWQLVCEYGPHIVAVVRRKLRRQIRVRLDSQDVVQAVWKSFFLDMPDINRIRTPEQLMAFLAGIAENKLLDAFRRHLYAERRALAHERPFQTGEDGGGDLYGPSATPSQFAVAKEQWGRMIGRRPAVHQEVIRRRLSGASFKSIGISLGISERTARRVIDDLWQEHCHDEA